ncbi:MAG TPA: repressor LexA [Chloroflexi bacterium]|nr:repressor LexA [Chloroflexota bacterium]
MKARNPNPGERELYNFIHQYSEKYGYTPSYQEMVDHTSSKTKSHIAHQLKNLEEAGWIEKIPHLPRAIRLNHSLPAHHSQGMIPLLGIIQAGAPIPLPGTDFAMFLPEDAVDVGSMIPLQKRRKDLFALRVLGDSMVDSNVQDGDIVVMEKAVQANNGEMVAAWMLEEEETTLKHFYKEKSQIRLQPANPKYEPILCQPNQVQIQGRVVMVIRTC